MQHTLTDSALAFVAANGGEYKHIGASAQDLITDANEGAFFDQELEHIKARSYDVLKRALKHREYLPVSFEAGPGAESISYTQYDQTGMAKLISNYAEDLPLANVKGRKYTHSVEGIGIGFKYSIQDVRASQMANKRLTDRQAKSAMRGNAELEEELACFGSSGLFNGFLNHPNVSVIGAIDVGGGDTEWIADGKDADQINDDISLMISTIVDTTNEVEQPNTLLMPSEEYVHISNKRIPNTAETYLSWLKKTNVYLKNIGTWDKLKNANAGGNGARLVMYDRDPEKLTLEIPQDFEMLPAQAEGLSFLVPTHSRFGGVIVYYPLSVLYMDDAG